MIAVDANILVHAHQREASLHDAADLVMRELAESRAPWGVCFHCFIEFYAVVTHNRLWKEPSSEEQAGDQIKAWTESPSLRILQDSEATLDRFICLSIQGRVRGGQAHDARIATCCVTHGVKELWTLDRDFSRYPELKTRSPLM